MDRCKAITKSWPFQQCKNNARCEGFCGVHNKSASMSNLCQGITKCGLKCTQPVKRGTICNRHLIPEQPDHDWFELKLYNPDINWPSMISILNRVKKVKSGKELGNVIETYNRIYFPVNYFPFVETDPSQIIINSNRFTILMMETFFVNYYLDYSTEYWQNVIIDLVKKTDNICWLSKYRNLFRKKFDINFREETKKNYIEKVFVQGGGTDVAKKIVSFI